MEDGEGNCANALSILVKLSQQHKFSNEIHLLANNKSIESSSSILSLSPFLDDNQIIRMGGRLQNAHL